MNLIKKTIPCLAVAAILTTGCSGAKTTIKADKFKEEVTEYGFLLNRTAKYEGTVDLGESGSGKYELFADSDGKNIAFANVFTGAEGSETYGFRGTIESGNVSGVLYMRDGDEEWDTTPVSNLPNAIFSLYLFEFTYFGPFAYEKFTYDKKEKAYTAKEYNFTLDETNIRFKDMSLRFKSNQLVGWKYIMGIDDSSQSITIDMERSATKGVEVPVPVGE